jgi:predicted XRE-type DNA-binding protein
MKHALRVLLWGLFGYRSRGLLITAAEAAEIRQLSEEGHWHQDELADQFGVHQSTISRILSGKIHAVTRE